VAALQKAASAADLLAGIGGVVVYASWFASPWVLYQCSDPWGCTHPSALVQLLPYLGGILLVCGVVSLAGFRVALVPGTAAAAIMAEAMGLIAAQSHVPVDVPLAVLSAGAAVLSFWALRSRTALSEQANPMNLPVFG
jgi:hypothetical protein